MKDILFGKGVTKDTVQLIYDRVLYPNQELFFLAKGKKIDYDGSKEGLICITNRSITLYQPRKWRNREIAYDYDVNKVKKYSYSEGWFSSEITIQMDDSRNVILQGINKGEEEQVISFIKESIGQYARFIEEQRSNGLFLYNWEVGQWGSREEAQHWFEQYMIRRGFKKSGDKWLTEEDYERRQKGLYTFIKGGIEKKGTLDEVLDGLSPSRFEEFVSLLFQSMGYETNNLPYVGDYGADVLLERNGEKTIVQVKKWSGNVGAPTVQKTLGSMWKYDANKAILVTTGNFTHNAYEQAEGAPIELWNRSKLKDELEQYLPSYLVSQKPISIQLFSELENTCMSIKSKVISRAKPRTAMRIKFNIKKERERLGLNMYGPLDYFPILETVLKEHVPIVPIPIQNFLKIWLKKEKLVELEQLQKTWNPTQ